MSYGLSSLRSPYGVSSLSSIVSYGLSTVYSPYGISSLSSIISYGLSTIAAQPNTGLSSLSSIISYGLSTIAAQPQYGVSSLSSIVSYGLSTVAAQPNNGVSTLSTIVYGFSNSFTTNNLFVLSNAGIRCNTPSYALDVNGSIQGQLASNSFDKDFSASDLGGTGIRDARYNTNVDTYVDSMFKMDSWIFNNIVGKPPAPRFISSNLTKQYIAVSWSNPILYSIGLLNTYVPHITNLLITLSNVTVPGDTIYTSPIVNISAQSNLPMYGTAIQGVQIYNAGTSNSIVRVDGINYKQTVNTTISPTNIYNMYISFSNFNLNENISINTLTVPNLSLLAAGVPSAPINLASSATLYTITITWSAPLSNDITDPNAIANGVSILNYRLAWSNIVDSIRPRRYTAGRDINTYNPITIIPSPLSYQITGLWPDSLYNISLSARNQLNNNYGQHITSASDILTGLHAAGDLIVTNNLSNYSPNQPTYAFSNRGSPANSRPGTSLIILNSNTIRTRQGLSFEYSNVAIQTASSPGISVPGDIMRIIGSNNLNSSVFLSNGGWTDSGDRSVSSCNMTISRTNVTDVYTSGCNTGFFQKATYKFTISNALLMPSQSPYTFFLTQSNFNNQFRTQTNNAIYVDTINGPPSINAIYHNSFFNPSDPTVYICGVFSYSNGAIFNNYLDMNNLGTYYLAQGTNGEFVSYYISIGSTPCGASNYGKGTDATPSIFNTGNTLYSSGILPNPARIETTIILNDPSNRTFTSSTNDLSLTARPVNLCNVGALTTNTLLYNSKKFYVDLPSIFVMSQTNSALNVRGVRVRADGESIIPNLANIGTFDNNISLMNGSYFYELQLVNGYYSTSNYSIDAYRNYSNYYYNGYNYSSPGTGTRYVMLLYSNTTNNINSIEKIKFQFTYAPGGAFPIRAFDTQFSRFESNITLQYKFISALATTGWLNGNSNIDSFNSPASNYVNNGISGLNNSTFGTSPTVRVLQIPSGNHNGFQVYIRIGIPMTLPCAFSYLTYIGAE